MADATQEQEQQARPKRTRASGNGSIEGLSAELRRASHQAATRKAKLREMTAQLQSVTQERDQLRTRAVEPGEREQTLQARVDELTGQLRGVKHRGTFDRVAKDLKVRPEALEDVWKLSGYTPDSDQVDEQKIKGAIGEYVKSRPYLLAPDEAVASGASGGGRDAAPGGANGAQSSQGTGHRPGPGADRGQSSTSNGGGGTAPGSIPGRL